MTTWWFPDNTVLCNYAAIERLDVLEKTLAGRGRWTEAVAYEARQSARWLAALRPLLMDGWLGEPIEIADPAAVARVDVIRRTVFGGLPGQPLKHLGEAQTLFLLDNDETYQGGRWLTDDRGAYEYAKRRGLPTWDTVDVMTAAVADGIVTAADAFALLHDMRAADRALRRMPRSPDDLTR